jgi:hypothetical protein
MSATKEELEQILKAPNGMFKTVELSDGSIIAKLTNEGYLLLCPFCGTSVEVMPDDEHLVYHRGHEAMGGTIECPLINEVFPRRYWNNRHSLSEEQKLKEALKILDQHDDRTETFQQSGAVGTGLSPK